MEYIFQGASIECADADIISRKILPAAIQNIPKIGICRRYTCQRNSEAFIIKNINEALYKDTSHINKGDSLKAENLAIFIKSTKTIEKEKCPYTGRHNVQYMSSKYYTYAEITQQFPNIPIITDSKQIPASPKKLKDK